ncbi:MULTISPECIES: prepilin-type N-terminal cleavage/methylation domain-containing protein [unclassified Halomonas]|uniref:type IV pilus modification PilV family protein n=1 Tax=unclassified Halomonas TaxID=2609666 RepID=UPI0025542690|nr:prepilin-type N-terminal cleavage/methylation domain-containing protein [Halomonas sp. LC1]MDK9687667.1 prepilin-type N-terminal cleavage/methylation domain-containing protein [Halomonas sp. LC1]
MKRQQGFSLIEVLIALVVLAFGLMGVAAMQLKSLQSATEGYQRSVAVVAAVDAQERVWNLLANYPNCENIDADAVRALESDWIDHWSEDASVNPLRDANWDNSSVTLSDSCEFTIVISLKSMSSNGEDEYRYRFTLPNTGVAS